MPTKTTISGVDCGDEGTIGVFDGTTGGSMCKHGTKIRMIKDEQRVTLTGLQ